MRAPPLLDGCRPILFWGQSNIAGGYRPISDWPIRLRSPQLCVPKCHHLVCYGPVEGGTPVNASSVDATWRPVQSFTVTSGDMSGVQVGNWGIDLADGLLGAGIRPAIVEYCAGGTQLEYWTAGANGSQYATIAAWCQARIAELTNALPPTVVFYQGESGSVSNYTTLLGQFTAGVRATFGALTKIVIVQIPASYTPAVTIGEAQAAYVATDPLCRLAYCHDSTFVMTEPANLHIDTASGRRLAVGPTTGTNRSVLTCIRSLLGD